MTNVFGEIDGLSDFGIVAGAGVAGGSVSSLQYRRCACSSIADGSRRSPLAAGAIDQAIPGAAPSSSGSSLGGSATGTHVGVTAVVTVTLAGVATQIESTFDNNDFANGTESKEDVLFIQETLGDNTEPVTVLIEAELASERTARNILDLSFALEDPGRRPDGWRVGDGVGRGSTQHRPRCRTPCNRIHARPETPLIVTEDAIQAGLDLCRKPTPPASMRWWPMATVRSSGRRSSSSTPTPAMLSNPTTPGRHRRPLVR